MHGTFYVTHAVGKRWIAAKQKGSVVSIIVTWVYNSGPFVVPSAMSKSAIATMTRSLAVEWGRYGIRLNAIAPGVFPTEGAAKRLRPGEEPGAHTIKVNPMGRVGQMSELQNLATFLLAPGCEWLNGETITVDGAQHLVRPRADSTTCANGTTNSGARRATRSARRTTRTARREGLSGSPAPARHCNRARRRE